MELTRIEDIRKHKDNELRRREQTVFDIKNRINTIKDPSLKDVYETELSKAKSAVKKYEESIDETLIVQKRALERRKEELIEIGENAHRKVVFNPSAWPTFNAVDSLFPSTFRWPGVYTTTIHMAD